MLSVIAALSSVVAYAAPTNEIAHRAFTDRILASSLYVEYALEMDYEFLALDADFPSQVTVRKCQRRFERKTVLDNGATVWLPGYDCIFEVWPNTEPSYLKSGFFHYDGLKWVYYGTIKETHAPKPIEYEAEPGWGETTNKPGSLSYDGSPADPFNEDYDPYQDHFERSLWGERRF